MNTETSTQVEQVKELPPLPNIQLPITKNGETMTFIPNRNRRNPESWYFGPQEDEKSKMVKFNGPTWVNETLFSEMKIACRKFHELSVVKDSDGNPTGQFDKDKFVAMVQSGLPVRLSIADLEDEMDKVTVELRKHLASTENIKECNEDGSPTVEFVKAYQVGRGLSRRIAELSKAIDDKRRTRKSADDSSVDKD